MCIDVPTNGKPNQDGAVLSTAAAAAVDTTTPLCWWRTLPPTAYTAVHVEAATTILSRLAIFGEPKWSAAADDPSAEIAVAVRADGDGRVTAILDIAMTALLRHASAGDPAAALVLATKIDRLIGGLIGWRLSSSWLAHVGLPLRERCRIPTASASTPSDQPRG